MVPQEFNGIELRRVRRQIVDLPPMAIFAEPSPHLLVFMVGGVVLNIENATWVVPLRYTIQKVKVRAGVEHRVTAIQEP